MDIMRPIIRMVTFVFWLTVMLLLPACSSHIPPEIKQDLDTSPGIEQVLKSSENYLSQKVRWGGVILNTENKHEASWLTILAYPLNNYGKPQVADQSSGRFIAIVDKFLEPLVYSSDRKITITGKLLRTETIKVGEFPYKYPVIQVEKHYLWPDNSETSNLERYPYWWYDPWYDPYYPWHSPYYPYRHIR